MAVQYHLSEADIRSFKRKSRCFYNFPVSLRDDDNKAIRVQYVFCVDSTKPSIESARCPHKMWSEIVESLINGMKDLLAIQMD